MVECGQQWPHLVSLGHFDCHTVSMNSGRRFLRAEFEKDLANGELFWGWAFQFTWEHKYIDDQSFNERKEMTTNTLNQVAYDKLRETALRVRMTTTAIRLWDMLSVQEKVTLGNGLEEAYRNCLLYTSDAADE